MSHKPPRTGSQNPNLQLNFLRSPSLQWHSPGAMGSRILFQQLLPGIKILLPAAQKSHTENPGWNKAGLENIKPFLGQNCVTARGEACARPEAPLSLPPQHKRMKGFCFLLSFLRKIFIFSYLSSPTPAGSSLQQLHQCLVVSWPDDGKQC